MQQILVVIFSHIWSLSTPAYQILYVLNEYGVFFFCMLCMYACVVTRFYAAILARSLLENSLFFLSSVSFLPGWI